MQLLHRWIFPTWSLVDGRRVELRPAVPADRSAIAAFFLELSDESRYLRFFGPMPPLRDPLLDQLVANRSGQASFVGLSRERLQRVVGHAAFAHLPAEDSCELAVVVSDGWQRVGLGTLMLLTVIREARVAGHRRFHGEVMGANAPMLHLLQKIASPLRSRVEGGVCRVEFEI